jgi:hypothetical protein
MTLFINCYYSTCLSYINVCKWNILPLAISPRKNNTVQLIRCSTRWRKMSTPYVIGKTVNEIWLTYLWCWTYGEIAKGNIFNCTVLFFLFIVFIISYKRQVILVSIINLKPVSYLFFCTKVVTQLQNSMRLIFYVTYQLSISLTQYSMKSTSSK